MSSPVAGYLEALAHGYLGEIRDALADGAVVDDPEAGRIAGFIPLERFLVDAHQRLAAARSAARLLRETSRGGRAVAEWVWELDVKGERRAVPVAAAGELNQAGRIAALRIYHSFWPLEGHHRVRPRLLPARHDLRLAPPVAAYQRALAKGDLEGVLAQFEPGGAAREPAGGPHLHRGPESLRGFYGALFSNGGGIPLEHCSATDDGVACAVEYSVVRWGRTALPPQAGIAVYERGPSGLLAWARIYDDVDPPLPH
ncbi:MAG TPA: nuclear transport factor 2 family protein [Anaeromyxobacteraceae bacterium]|nr:nuclear transport factor 2 family protein [Anaeromyxobacteraceae bacterium]